MIERIKQLERYGLASETELGRWVLSDRTEMTLKELGARNDIIKIMHRTLTESGLADVRGLGQYALHRARVDQPVVGRLVAKGLAVDEMEDRAYLVIDGVDGRVHHIEVADAANLNEVKRGMIVEGFPVISAPRSADRNLAINAEKEGGLYRPSRHLEKISDRFVSQGKDPEAFVRSHVRRLEALRLAGLVEQRKEVQRVGQKLAADRGLTFMPGEVRQHVTGRLSGIASLASGRFAMIEDGLSFQLVPWQAILDKRIGQTFFWACSVKTAASSGVLAESAD
jgi:Protein of unknown function (DUF3363)